MSFHTKLVRVASPDPARMLSVMQFNVLARQLEPPAVDANDDASVQAMKFVNRSKLNAAHVLAMQPSLVVMEEVDDPAEFYGPALESEGYRYIFGRKQLVDRERPCDATCVFWKPEALDLLAHKVKYFCPQRTHFVVMAHFLHKASGLDFGLVAQHAKAGRTAELEALRLSDVATVMNAWVPRFFGVPSAKEVAGGRLLWAADLNAGPTTYGGKWPCRLLPWVQGEPEPPQPADAAPAALPPTGAGSQELRLTGTEPNPLPLRSAIVDATGEHPVFTTCKKTWRDGSLVCQTIDYVFVAPGTARCTAYLPCPVESADALAPLYLPSSVWGSDHLSVFVELELTAASGSPSQL